MSKIVSLVIATFLACSTVLVEGQTSNPATSNQTNSTKPADNANPTPTPSPTPDDHTPIKGVYVVLGVGSLVGSGASNYKIQSNNQVLEAQNLGRATPQLLTGLSFGLPFRDDGGYNSASEKDSHVAPCNSPGWNHVCQPWHAVVSLKLSPNTSDVINGYVIGLAYRLSTHFALLGGYSLTPYNEPTPGFRNAAAQVVKNNQTVPIYQTFDPNAMLANKPNAFDGFPLAVQSATGPTGTQVYLGDPLVTHSRGGFVFGVTFPISLLGSAKQ